MNHDLLNSALVTIADSVDPKHAGYGVTVDNEKFEMHPYCWCESDECPWCGEMPAPNFRYKPTGFSVWWYKYIGRGTEVSKRLSGKQISDMLKDCLT